MADYHYRESGTRNICSNHNQMKAFCECYPNSIKKILSNRHFHRAIGETLKIPENFWLV